MAAPLKEPFLSLGIGTCANPIKALPWLALYTRDTASTFGLGVDKCNCEMFIYKLEFMLIWLYLRTPNWYSTFT